MSAIEKYEAMTADEQRRYSRRAAWRWGTLVVTFLTLQVGIGVAAIVLSTGDRSVAIEPDYYQVCIG